MSTRRFLAACRRAALAAAVTCGGVTVISAASTNGELLALGNVNGAAAAESVPNNNPESNSEKAPNGDTANAPINESANC